MIMFATGSGWFSIPEPVSFGRYPIVIGVQSRNTDRALTVIASKWIRSASFTPLRVHHAGTTSQAAGTGGVKSRRPRVSEARFPRTLSWT